MVLWLRQVTQERLSDQESGSKLELQATKVAYWQEVKSQHIVGLKVGQKSEVTGELCG